MVAAPWALGAEGLSAVSDVTTNGERSDCLAAAGSLTQILDRTRARHSLQQAFAAKVVSAASANGAASGLWEATIIQLLPPPTNCTLHGRARARESVHGCVAKHARLLRL
eukprot:1911583-Rhodomonas_salina.1